MYRLLNVNGRAALERDGHWHDLAMVSGDKSLADPMIAVGRSGELHALSERCSPSTAGGLMAEAELGAPVPEPRQVFGIGLNYRDHAGESGMELPPAPLTFTKFPSCIVGPTATVPLSGRTVDWEAEIVVAIGAKCSSVDTFRRLGCRCRPHARAGHLRSGGPTHRHATPVLPGQELPVLRSHRTCPRLGRRVRRPERHRAVV